jgi:hypothetical protein
MTPEDAEKSENKNFVASALNEYYTPIFNMKKKPRFALNEIVRIYKLRGIFSRGYFQRFSNELFQIVKIQTRMPIPSYKLKSLLYHDIIRGSFYANELQVVPKELQ